MECKSSGQVASLECPKLSPAKGKLMSIEAQLSGKATFAVVAIVSVPGPANYQFDGTQSVELVGGSIDCPAKASGMIQAGPIATNPMNAPPISISGPCTRMLNASLVEKFVGDGLVQLLARADALHMEVTGSTSTKITPVSATSDIRLIYRYVPTVIRLRDVPSLPPQKLPKPGPQASVVTPN